MKRTVFIATVVVISTLTTLSGHVVRGILYPTQATALVSSPSAAEDAPVAIRWGAVDTGLRVVCVNVANTSPVLPGSPGYPRVTAVGFARIGILPHGFYLRVETR